ncbi:NADPH-dependent FMN reductase [Brevibacterium jeotgali]|uniref:NAD(P)H-dependent FMN reductase n=1 Tax=Brevibacterium jeotgali TaxID=1262550 RepID=A0A2H1L102_9MICO|nr:NADPH-dependent FMN reductase [Brevibacterium jeotgali]TWC02058.1 NAD(P)H-dependent FMN reductase [Brevibacterium jeotgali]SMY10591.1 NAD(P)H-dependent FMN reductase [Brevibacterium jeotgali]
MSALSQTTTAPPHAGVTDRPHDADSDRPRIGIIVGSTRPVRIGRQIADAVADVVADLTRDEFSGVTPVILDLREIALPFLDEPAPPSSGERTLPHSRAWSEAISEVDGCVFVTAEYNGGYPAPLKNAIDFLKDEWADLPGSIVSYGGAGGTSAAAQLRTVLTRLRVDLAEVDSAIRVRSRHYGEDRTLLNAAEVVAESTASLRSAVGWVSERAQVRAEERGSAHAQAD